MNYLGGKSRISDWVAENVLCRTTSRTRYVEPFVGSGAVWLEVAPHFRAAHGSDLMPDAVMYLNALRDGWIPPSRVSKKEREELRWATEPSALRGFVGFCCGFRGKFFMCNVWPQSEVPRIARGEARRIPRLRRCPAVVLQDYRRVEVGPGDVVYCDPPYGDTTGYSWVGRFNTYEFWAVMARWVRSGATVFVSEEDAPVNWVIAAEQVRARTTSYDPATGKNGSKLARERIYAHESQVEDRMTTARHRAVLESGARRWPAIE